MTLCISILTKKQCVVCADRRISGSPGSEEHNKTILLFTDDARVILTYTGLAKASSQAGSFDAEKWLLQNLPLLDAPFTLESIIERLAPKLTSEFATNPAIQSASKANRRFSLAGTGYLYEPNGPQELISRGVMFVITNFQRDFRNPLSEAEDQFTLLRDPLVKEVDLVVIGNCEGLFAIDPDGKECDRIEKFALTARPQALAAKLVNLIRKAAFHRKSLKLIGQQISSTILLADFTQEPPPNMYHSAKVRRAMHAPAIAYVQTNNRSAASNIKIEPVDPTALPLSVPEVRQNDLCPCGSGKKYKNCHARKKKPRFKPSQISDVPAS